MSKLLPSQNVNRINTFESLKIFKSNAMDTEFLKSQIKTNIYQITSDSNVGLHKHQKNDEIFYCIKGNGFGVLENEEKEMNVGDVFVVKMNKMHALRSDSEMWVASFLFPLVD